MITLSYIMFIGKILLSKKGTYEKWLKPSLALGLSLMLTVGAQDTNKTIEYNVIALLNQTVFESMAVVVDNVRYTLGSNSTFPIIHSTKAPVAQSGYHYVKLYSSNNRMLAEPFMRLPVTENTPHEFFGRSWNIHNNYQLPKIYPRLEAIHRIDSKLHLDNEIPTIHIAGDQVLFDQMHRNTTTNMSLNTNLTYVSLQDVLHFENVEISLSGRSSRWLSKLSYKLKLKKKDSLYGYRHLRLRALGTDPSYLRERLAFDMLKSVGLVSSEFSYIRLFINDQEIGLYGFIDTFKNPWLSNVFNQGNKSYENGYLYQGTYVSGASSKQNLTSDLSYHDNQALYALGQYDIEQEGSSGNKNNWSALIDFTQFIAQKSDSADVWKKKFDTESFLRSIALEVLVGYSDGYLALADNYYLYQQPNGRYFYISSDLDLTFGSCLFKRSDMSSGNYSTFPGIHDRPLTQSIFRVPEFKDRFVELLKNINAKLFDPSIIHSRINDIIDMIKEDVIWDKTLARVGRNSFNVASRTNSDLGASRPIKTDKLTTLDLVVRINQIVPFEVAIYGPTGHISLAGVKEWVATVHHNTAHFFSIQ